MKSRLLSVNVGEEMRAACAREENLCGGSDAIRAASLIALDAKNSSGKEETV